MKCTISLIFLCLISFSVFGQVINYKKSAGIIFDQDVLGEFIGLNEDRNYTQGLSIYFTNKSLSKLFDKKFRLKDPSQYVLNFPVTVQLQLAGFTPDDLTKVEPIVGERPYSSVLFLSFKDARVDQARYRARFWSFYFGVLGIPEVAKNGQTWIHERKNKNNTIPPYNPAGWHNQISNGGEPTLMVSYGVKRLITKGSIQNEIARGSESKQRKITNYQLTKDWQVDLGYVTQGTYGFDFRIGSINLKKWHQGAQWSSGPIPEKLIDNPKFNYFNNISNNFEAFIFVGMRAGLMVYNASLHGQFRHSNYRLYYWDTGFFTNTGRIGFTVNTNKFGLTIYGAFKNAELMTQYARIHTWGGFNLNINFGCDK